MSTADPFETLWENFFKPETRSAGRSIYAKGVVNVSQPSDTELSAFIKTSASVRVKLVSPSMSASELYASCGCPMGKKGQLCKHVWAALLQAEQSRPDFFDGKSSIDAAPANASAFGAASKSARPIFEAKPPSQAQVEAREAMKARQNDYRKEQYQKQKAKLKGQKSAAKATRHGAAPELPDDLQAALKYFAANGFPMPTPFSSDDVNAAKKKLSRIFHPDKGGSHDEILELNNNSDLLLEFTETT